MSADTIDLREPVITRKDILRVDDPHFNRHNVCIVTGASSGIGRAVALAMAANDLTVVCADINVAGGGETVALAEELGGKAVFVPVDLTVDESMSACVEKAAGLGNIKYLANIAGLQHIDPIERFPMKIYDLMQAIMLRAPFFLTQLVIPHIRNSADGTGAIGNMASIHAHICTLNKPVYNITKFGLRGLSQSTAAEGEGKIRAFTVSVGFVKTPLALGQIPSQAKQRGITQEEVVRDVMMGKSRVKEMMSPVDVANLFVFGMSRHGNYLVGGDLLFDGGVVLTY